MAGYAGRLFLLAQETTPGGGTYTTIAGLRNTTITINNSTVDVTTKDDAGVRQLLNAKVLNSMSVSADGVCQDNATLKTLRDAAVAGTTYNFKITTPGDNTAGVSYTGAFIVTSFEEGGAHEGEATFSCSLESAGDITIAALT